MFRVVAHPKPSDYFKVSNPQFLKSEKPKVVLLSRISGKAYSVALGKRNLRTIHTESFLVSIFFKGFSMPVSLSHFLAKA